MKLISLLLIFTAPLGALHTPKITQLEYKKHSYLVFDGKQYLHNPDCSCSLRMYGFIDYYNDEVDIILYRDWVSHHD